MKRIIIAGSRDFNNYKLLEQSLLDFIGSFEHNQIEIISGTARGADRLGEQFSNSMNYNLVRFPADWDKYGKSAGYRRNAEMAKYASEEDGVLFAFWDGQSRGTKHMIDLANKYDLEVHVINY